MCLLVSNVYGINMSPYISCSGCRYTCLLSGTTHLSLSISPFGNRLEPAKKSPHNYKSVVLSRACPSQLLTISQISTSQVTEQQVEQ